MPIEDGQFRPNDLLVCVIVHSRYWNLERWLHTWQCCEHYGDWLHTKLCVVYNQAKRRCTSQIHSLTEKYKPDFLLERSNKGMDIGALRDVVTGKHTDQLPHWDTLLWFTDDTIPMQQDFIAKYVEAMQPQSVGLVGCHISYEKKFHVRTNGIGMRRPLWNLIKFPQGDLTKKQCYAFEHETNSLTDQVIGMGYEIDSVGNLHEVAWDIGHHNHLNELANWERYFAEFPECRQFGTRN